MRGVVWCVLDEPESEEESRFTVIYGIFQKAEWNLQWIYKYIVSALVLV